MPPPARCDLTTAIQVKRVKIDGDAFHTLQPNGLSKLIKGVKQANLLAKLGFSRVYLYVFLAIDSREVNAGRNVFSGMSPALLRVVRDAIDVAALNARVGLIEHEFVQPVDRAPFTTGAFGGRLVRSAEMAIQPEALTEWVAQLFAERSGMT